jgi:Protein of Unknown function (DUF2784)
VLYSWAFAASIQPWAVFSDGPATFPLTWLLRPVIAANHPVGEGILEGVVYWVLADAVMLAHFGFLGFVALGGFVAWRYRWVLVLHLVAVAWGMLSVTVGLECPLTAGENALRRLGDEEGLPRGFIDTYVTGVVYPRQYLPVAQFLVAALVVVSWVGLAVRSPART